MAYVEFVSKPKPVRHASELEPHKPYPETSDHHHLGLHYRLIDRDGMILEQCVETTNEKQPEHVCALCDEQVFLPNPTKFIFSGEKKYAFCTSHTATFDVSIEQVSERNRTLHLYERLHANMAYNLGIPERDTERRLALKNALDIRFERLRAKKTWPPKTYDRIDWGRLVIEMLLDV